MRLPRRLAPLAAVFTHPLTPYLWALAVQLVFVGYVKDDAYIEYRYATNFARGHGLTFNVGDAPVEGFTSFLWTLALSGAAWLHLPLLALCKLASVAALVGIIATTAQWVKLRGGDAAAAQLARWLVATNASLLVWAQSGMEPVVTAFVVLLAFHRLEQRRHGAAMLLLAVAAGLRPECHLVLLLGALVTLRRRAWLPVLMALALVAAMHLWRWRYFGSVVPNTALVKAGALQWLIGLRALGELAITSLAALTILLSLVAVARRRDDVGLACAAALVLFAAYLVRIGRDEMFLVRLYLPVWPLALGLSAPLLTCAWRWRPPLGALVPLTVFGFGLGFTAARLHTIHYRELGERSHVVLAELMKQHAKPGDLVVFQDIGQTPWAAMELRFIDPIGLVDRTIARLRWSEHASPFMHEPSGRTQAAIRDHVFALRPKLMAFVAYTNEFAPEVRAQVDAAHTPAEQEAALSWFVDANPYHVGLHRDPRFAAYHFVGVVRRKDDYWFVLYERPNS
jgi:arabinofuranosyltransferase